MIASPVAEVWPLLAQRSRSNFVQDPGNAVLTLWLIFNIVPSHVLLPLLCTSLLLARARRNILLVNVAFTWIITGLVSSLLLYSGNQTGAEPSMLLCSTQASLLYAVPPMTSTAVLALVVSVWINLCWKPGERTRGLYLAIMLIVPYIVFFTFSAVAGMIAMRDPKKVSRRRRFFYCSVNSPNFSAALAIYAAIILLITMVFNVWIGVSIYRNSMLLKQAIRQSDDIKKRLKPDDIQFAIRLGIFGVYIVIGLALSFLSIVAPTSAVPDVILSTMGTAVFLVFGTQPKLWLVWRDIFRRGSPPQEESHIPTLTPYQLDPPPPGQLKQYSPDEDAFANPGAPPPVPEKPWKEQAWNGTRPPSMSMEEPSPSSSDHSVSLYSQPSTIRHQRSMKERRAPAMPMPMPMPVPEPEPRRPVSIAGAMEQSYASAASQTSTMIPEPGIVAYDIPVPDRTSLVRGKQPISSPFVPASYESGNLQPVISSYESQSYLLASSNYENQIYQPQQPQASMYINATPKSSVATSLGGASRNNYGGPMAGDPVMPRY